MSSGVGGLRGGEGQGLTVTADDAGLVLAVSVVKQHMTVRFIQQGQHRACSDVVTVRFHDVSGMAQGQREEVGQVAGLTAAAT